MIERLLWSSLVVVVVVVLTFLVPARATGDKIQCVADDGNHECTETSSCDFDNQNNLEYPECPNSVETGVPSYKYAFGSPPYCSKCSNSRISSGPPNEVQVHMRPFNNDYFIVNVSWIVVHDSLVHGYIIQLEAKSFNGENNPPSEKGCHCIQGKQTTHQAFYMEYSYDKVLSTCEKLRHFVTKVGTTYNGDYQPVDKYWPTNCYNFSLDLDELRRICGPRTPQPVREIRAFSEFFNNSDNISIKFEWDIPPDAYPNYPLTYYLDVYFDPKSLNVVGSYKTHNSTSVTLSPLSRNLTYIFVITTYQPELCTFDNCKNYVCSSHTHIEYTPFIPTEDSSSSIVMSSSQLITLSSSPSVVHTPSNTILVTTPSSVHQNGDKSIKVVASVGSSLTVVLILALITLALVVSGIYCTKKSAPSSPSPIPSTIYSSSDEGGRSTPMSPSSVLTFMEVYEAILIESKQTPIEDREAAIQYLCTEKYLGKYVRVGYLDRYEQITPAEWLQQMDAIPKIICVVNEWFHREWIRETPGTLVAALKTMVVAMVHSQRQNLSSKFVLFFLENGDEVYVPDYLNAVNARFYFADQDIVGLAHYITGVREFEFPTHHTVTVAIDAVTNGSNTSIA
ncbi:PREDICTED: uncharacterized protein LOC109586254 [Amphimedon queenslandica]|uniref:Fibronectin type-III domain-containing protein n=1 Tax=Amphimedon queenslandica TaxID=400682 RepID=A0A1X7VR00_AMPQE|nr:PREDICTED: uncharacterized protein LOC109586254 [Amphimedon queenslandica]|eukprot:XP_019857988.1 PREDICTED: uncharacterized protein LOC109586254 [Amphimedon queenslandica]